MKDIFIRFTAIVTAAAFLAEGLAWSAPLNSPQSIVHSPQMLDNIYIPEQYGRIERANGQTDGVPASAGRTNGQTVILIKDAHCNYEAQTNIAKILETLVRDYKIDLVCVEGAEGLVDTSTFSAYPDQKTREKVADKYVKKGYLCASEALSIAKADSLPFTIYGVEDTKLYLENFREFRNTMNNRQETGRYIDVLINITNNLKNNIYNEDLNVFDRKQMDYEEDRIGLTEWVKCIRNQKPETGNQRNLNLVLRAVDLEEKIDFNKVERERETLIRELEKQLTKEDLRTLIEKSLLFKLGKISSLDYYKYLGQYLKNGKYVDLMRYIHLVKIQSRIDGDGLFKEIEKTGKAIREGLFRDNIERELSRIAEGVRILKKLYNLNLTRDELGYYKDNKSNFYPSKILPFVLVQARLNNIAIPPELNDEGFLNKVEQFMQPAEYFYQKAIERDSVLVSNLLKKMGKDNKNKAVIVTGGFHSEGIIQRLKDKGISCITITPKITKIQEDCPYLDIMMDEKIDVAKVLAELGIENIPPARLISDLGQRFFNHVRQAMAADEIGDTTVNDLIHKYPDTEQGSLRKLFKLAGISVETKLGDLAKIFKERYTPDYIKGQIAIIQDPLRRSFWIEMLKTALKLEGKDDDEIETIIKQLTVQIERPPATGLTTELPPFTSDEVGNLYGTIAYSREQQSVASVEQAIPRLLATVFKTTDIALIGETLEVLRIATNRGSQLACESLQRIFAEAANNSLRLKVIKVLGDAVYFESQPAAQILKEIIISTTEDDLFERAFNALATRGVNHASSLSQPAIRPIKELIISGLIDRKPEMRDGAIMLLCQSCLEGGLASVQVIEEIIADSQSDETKIEIIKYCRPFYNDERIIVIIPFLISFIINSQNDMLKQTSINALWSLSVNVIAKGFNINIKLARYLKERGHFEKLLQNPIFKQRMNELAFNLNREVTLHPAERRVGEDEKTSLFDLLFASSDSAQAKDIFDKYFRNDPEQYRVEISKLTELLQNLSIGDIKKIILSIKENPEESLDEIKVTLTEQLKDHPGTGFVIREMEWILSNLFVLEQKIGLLEPISDALQKQGEDIKKLIEVLGQIDSAKKFTELDIIAVNNNLDVVDILRFKLESISQEAREDILTDTLQILDSLQDEEKKNNLYNELSTLFSFQPIQSQIRIYLRLLFIQSTDNKMILDTIEQVRMGQDISGLKKTPFIRQFLSENRNIAAENTLLHEYLVEAVKDIVLQKEALKQLRSLYQDRIYSSKKLKSHPDAIQKQIRQLHGQIALSKPVTQIPHIFYEPLLRINPDPQAFNIVRQLIASINSNKSMHNQSATLKNRLYAQMVYFSTLDYSEKGKLFSRILLVLAQQYGPPSVENVEQFYSSLMFYLEQYSRVIESLQKAQDKAFSEDINTQLLNLTQTILNAIFLEEPSIDDDSIKQLASILAKIEADVLLARFKRKIQIEDEAGTLIKLKDYAANNPRFKWVDHSGRNIYRLIDIYLSTIEDEEIYRNMLDALIAEVEGRFELWKYESEDYIRTMDEIIEIEVSKLSLPEQKRFQDAIEHTEGNTLYDKLKKISGFEEIRAKIEKIKNWEKRLQRNALIGTDREVTLEFTDDFYTLFNIGNYKWSTACQSCTYGNNLNRGLTGYVVNGTNKAVAVLDEDRRIITRRIVRLRILKDENGNKQPVIFVEESYQFGTEGVDDLYRLLDNLSQETGLPIVSSQHKPAQTDKVKEGITKKYAIELYHGRSEFDYSDSYGYYVQGNVNVGLYRQTEPVIVPRGFFDLLEKQGQASVAISVAGQMKAIGKRDPTNEDNEVSFNEDEKKELSEIRMPREITVNGSEVKIVCTNSDKMKGLVAHHFEHNGTMYIAKNGDVVKMVLDEGEFHEIREIYWMSKGFSQHEAHVIASAEQVFKFSPDYFGGRFRKPTPYHLACLRVKSPEKLQDIILEDEKARKWHHDVLERAISKGAHIDIQQIKDYEKILRRKAANMYTVKVGGKIGDVALMECSSLATQLTQGIDDMMKLDARKLAVLREIERRKKQNQGDQDGVIISLEELEDHLNTVLDDFHAILRCCFDILGSYKKTWRDKVWTLLYDGFLDKYSIDISNEHILNAFILYSIILEKKPDFQWDEEKLVELGKIFSKSPFWFLRLYEYYQNFFSLNNKQIGELVRFMKESKFAVAVGDDVYILQRIKTIPDNLEELASEIGRILGEKYLSDVANIFEKSNEQGASQWKIDNIGRLDIHTYLRMLADPNISSGNYAMRGTEENVPNWKASVDRKAIIPSLQLVEEEGVRDPEAHRKTGMAGIATALTTAVHFCVNTEFGYDMEIGFFAAIEAITENLPFMKPIRATPGIGISGIMNDWKVSGNGTVPFELGILLIPDKFREKYKEQLKGYRVYFYKPDDTECYHKSDGFKQMMEEFNRMHNITIQFPSGLIRPIKHSAPIEYSHTATVPSWFSRGAMFKHESTESGTDGTGLYFKVVGDSVEKVVQDIVDTISTVIKDRKVRINREGIKQVLEQRLPGRLITLEDIFREMKDAEFSIEETIILGDKISRLQSLQELLGENAIQRGGQLVLSILQTIIEALREKVEDTETIEAAFRMALGNLGVVDAESKSIFNLIYNELSRVLSTGEPLDKGIEEIARAVGTSEEALLRAYAEDYLGKTNGEEIEKIIENLNRDRRVNSVTQTLLINSLVKMVFGEKVDERIAGMVRSKPCLMGSINRLKPVVNGTAEDKLDSPVFDAMMRIRAYKGLKDGKPFSEVRGELSNDRAVVSMGNVTEFPDAAAGPKEQAGRFSEASALAEYLKKFNEGKGDTEHVVSIPYELVFPELPAELPIGEVHVKYFTGLRAVINATSGLRVVLQTPESHRQAVETLIGNAGLSNRVFTGRVVEDANRLKTEQDVIKTQFGLKDLPDGSSNISFFTLKDFKLEGNIKDQVQNNQIKIFGITKEGLVPALILGSVAGTNPVFAGNTLSEPVGKVLEKLLGDKGMQDLLDQIVQGNFFIKLMVTTEELLEGYKLRTVIINIMA